LGFSYKSICSSEAENSDWLEGRVWRGKGKENCSGTKFGLHQFGKRQIGRGGTHGGKKKKGKIIGAKPGKKKNWGSPKNQKKGGIGKGKEGK